MIPIRYDNYDLTQYRAFIDIFKGRMIKWCRSKQIGTKNVVAITEEALSFFYYLLSNNRLERIVFAEAEHLSRIIEQIEAKYPKLKADRLAELKGEHSDLYQIISKAFVELGYKTLPSEARTEIYDTLGIVACPYCNSQKIVLDAELDHFFPKGRVPYLAMCINNYVPSCGYCNGTNGKYEDDTYKKQLVNPHTLRDDKGIHFHLDYGGKGLFSLKQEEFESDVKIQVIPVKPILATNINTFNLLQQYSYHKVEAKAVWWYYRTRHSRFSSTLAKKVDDVLGTSYDFFADFDNLLKVNGADPNKAPFTKMSYDLIHDMFIQGITWSLKDNDRM